MKPIAFDKCPECKGTIRQVVSNMLNKRRVYLVCDNCHIMYAWNGRDWIKVVETIKEH